MARMIRPLFRKLWVSLIKNETSLKSGYPNEEVLAMGGGERQAASTLGGIRADHVARYKLASKYIPNEAHVLDAACGVGYGSYILAKDKESIRILAIDKDETAITYANQHYKLSNIGYQLGDILQIPLEKDTFDIIVSFETIEHIQEDKQLVDLFYKAIKPDGKLILSTPNQVHMPFSADQFPFHARHYTPAELITLTKDAGFKTKHVYAQPDAQTESILDGWSGVFNILVLTKEA